MEEGARFERERGVEGGGALFTGARSQVADDDRCTWRSDHLLDASGLVVFRGVAVAREATTLRHVAPDLPPGLSLHFTRGGTYTYRVAGMKGHVTADMSRHCWLMPEVNDIEFSLPAGTRLHNLSVRLPEALVRELAAAYRGPLPLARIAARGACEPFCLPLASPSACHRLVDQLAADTFAGAARRLHVEAKVLELLALSLDATERHEKTASGASPSPDERRRLAAARDRLAADPLDPPALTALAREVGLSPRRLNDGFRALFGVTVLGWLRDARLELGRNLLLDGLPIKEVAYRLGYSHVNNFTAAFRARFGEPPGRHRRSARPAP